MIETSLSKCLKSLPRHLEKLLKGYWLTWKLTPLFFLSVWSHGVKGSSAWSFGVWKMSLSACSCLLDFYKRTGFGEAAVTFVTGGLFGDWLVELSRGFALLGGDWGGKSSTTGLEGGTIGFLVYEPFRALFVTERAESSLGSSEGTWT